MGVDIAAADIAVLAAGFYHGGGYSDGAENLNVWPGSHLFGWNLE